MDQFFSWNYLASFAGVGAFTAIVTGFLKKYVPIPTQLLAYFVALAGLLLSHAFTSGLSLSTAVLCVFNAVIVGTATSGTYDAVRRVVNSKTGAQAAPDGAEAPQEEQHGSN